MGSFADCRESTWDRFKRSSKVTMIVGSILLFLFGCFFLIAGAYIGATVTTQVEQGAVIAAVICGVLLILFALLTGVAVRQGHGPVTYALFFFAFGLFVAGLVVVGIALTYLKRIESITGLPPPIQFSQNITDPALQEVSDYINSLYTYCCTGCTTAVCGKAINETAFCIQQTQIPNPPCKFVTQCQTPQGNDPDCFFSRDAAGTTPPVFIGEGICSFLKNGAWGSANTPVVGNIGTDPRKVSCGGGDPKIFAFSVRDWLFQQYAWISAIIGVILFILCVIMLATLAYDRNERDNYKAPRTHDQMRPFG